MGASFDRPLFVLGVERSGSTWLANILDAHPKSQLYLEPFAPQVRAFSDFPDRLVYLRGLNPFLEEHLEIEVGKLADYKYSLFQRRGDSRLKRKLVYGVVYPLCDAAARAFHALGYGWSPRVRRFKNLNKNRIENPELNQFSEVSEPNLTVLKEVRLNFKVGVINKLWPTARILVIVRNPLSQIASILRLLGQNSLHELRGALYVFLEHTRQCLRFQKYHDILTELDGESLVHRATAYWFLNYGTLIEDLEREGMTYQIVRHETLSRAPHPEREKIIDFAGLTEQGATQEYVDFSSRATNRVRSAMDTQRDSKRYYLEALRNVEEEVRTAFFDAADGFWRHAPVALRQYRSWLRKHDQA